MRIKIVIPCNNRNDLVPEVQQLVETIHEADKHISIVKSFSALASRARNDGIFGRHINYKRPGVLLEHDIYAFLDSDVCPEADDYLEALHNAKRNEFLTGLYQIRGGHDYACGFRSGPRLLTVPKEEIQNHEFVDWAGGGLIIVGSDVLKEMDNPFFHEGVISWKDKDGIDRSEIIGEDVVFSFKAISAGFKIKVLHNLIADHLTRE
jgi:cellulose synthase/poly-beta-1,6-N-acetylglucosamine synthase-like glycosyltransferase